MSDEVEQRIRAELEKGVRLFGRGDVGPLLERIDALRTENEKMRADLTRFYEMENAEYRKMQSSERQREKRKIAEIERLRAALDEARRIIQTNTASLEAAADTLELSRDRADALGREVERLRKALAPFADVDVDDIVADEAYMHPSGMAVRTHSGSDWLDVEAFRVARAVFAGELGAGRERDENGE